MASSRVFGGDVDLNRDRRGRRGSQLFVDDLARVARRHSTVRHSTVDDELRRVDRRLANAPSPFRPSRASVFDEPTDSPVSPHAGVDIGSDAHFRRFLRSDRYNRREDAINAEMDSVRRSNMFNEDLFDFALIVRMSALSNGARLRRSDGFADADADDDSDSNNDIADDNGNDDDDDNESSQHEIEMIDNDNNHYDEDKDKENAAAFCTPRKIRAPTDDNVNERTPILSKQKQRKVGILRRRRTQDSKSESRRRARDALRLLVLRLEAAGIEVRRNDPTRQQEDQVLLRLRAPEWRLELAAESAAFKMRLRGGGWFPFARSLRQQFLGSGDSSTLFRSSERQWLLWQILKERTHSDVSYGGVDIDALNDAVTGIAGVTVLHVFPLHMLARNYALDAAWRNWWKRAARTCFICFSQEARARRDTVLTSLAEYYGTEIAFYFAFLVHHTAWLVPPALAGLTFFLVRTLSNNGDSNSDERDDTAGNDKGLGGGIWYTSGDEQEWLLPLLLSLLLSLWCAVSLEMWKRREAELAYMWGTLNYEKVEERTRVGFRGELRRDPVTHQWHKHYPRWKRALKVCLATGTLQLLLLLASVALVVVLFRFEDRNLDSYVVQVMGAEWRLVTFAYGLALPVLDRCWDHAARRLTTWENWKLASTHTRHVTLKSFSFRFVNSFAAIYYYALTDLSMARVSAQVGSFFVASKLASFLWTVVYPWLHATWHSHCSSTEGEEPTSPDSETATSRALAAAWGNHAGRRGGAHMRYRMSQAWAESKMPQFGKFTDFCAIVVQFGFVALFSVAFPLAPLLALVWNVIEVRVDASKLMRDSQRPVASRAGGIKIWSSLLQAVSVLAVLTNCGLVFLTSGVFDGLLQGKKVDPSTLAMVFVVEHALLLLKLAVSLLIPRHSRELAHALRQEQALRHQTRMRLAAAVPAQRQDARRDSSGTQLTQQHSHHQQHRQSLHVDDVLLV
ncbi:MAG: hypothetical protein MHM6MM_003468 [Cercozoa sp. M6MM]